MLMFGRLLRLAGFRIGINQIRDAMYATKHQRGDREDFFLRLQTIFVKKFDERVTFQGAFDLFWYGVGEVENRKTLGTTDASDGKGTVKSSVVSVNEQLVMAENTVEDESTDELGVAASSLELLRERDFEHMSDEEWEAAKRFVRTLSFPALEIRSRRHVLDNRGTRVDMAATLRRVARAPGGVTGLLHSRRTVKRCPLVVICDISGSMGRYSRMLLHFVHALTNYPDALHAFVFATRLTNITRYLKTKQVDSAVDQITRAVTDWSGGTRIGRCLREFNRRWLRRVLGQGAVVLLITDGLDRDIGGGLDQEIWRLHASSRRLIWLNPLMRYDQFEPRSWGMRVMLPHVDVMHSVHNLNSLVDLSSVLSENSTQESRYVWTP